MTLRGEGKWRRLLEILLLSWMLLRAFAESIFFSPEWVDVVRPSFALWNNDFLDQRIFQRFSSIFRLLYLIRVFLLLLLLVFHPFLPSSPRPCHLRPSLYDRARDGMSFVSNHRGSTHGRGRRFIHAFLVFSIAFCKKNGS